MNTYTNEQLSHTNSSAGSFLTGVFLGSLAGAVTMLFLAPQSGKETRQQIQQKAMDLQHQATATVETKLTQIRTKADQLKADVEEKAKSLKHQGQDVLVNQLDRVSEAVESSKKLIQGNNGKSS
jgi:gas vesicle protein